MIKPALKEKWPEITNTELGMMDSLFGLAYSFFQIPFGLCVDFVGARFFLGAIIILWSVALGLHAWAPTPTIMNWIRFLCGAGQAAAYASLVKASKAWFPLATRTSLQGWVASFGRFGAVSTYFLFATVFLGWLHMGW